MKRIIDISYHVKSEQVNYDILLAQVDGVILRCGYGCGARDWYGKYDTAFDRHYAEVKTRGIPVGTYFYLVEYETVDDQLAIVKRALDGKSFELGLWNDVELEGGDVPDLTRKTVIEFMTKAEAIFGTWDIYTGAWCWNPIMGYDNPYSSRKLWVSGYSGDPYMPTGWDKWWMHQYTSSGRLDGYSGNLDMNKCTDENWQIWVENIKPEIIEPLELNLMSQKDSKWSSDKLGTSSITIGAYGCLITSVAMICNYYGKETNPGKINQDLINVNGYANDNLLKFASIETVYPDIIVDWESYLSNPTDKQIDTVLKSNIPVIVQVDYKPDTPALDQHWVVIIGKDKNGYLIADPINGNMIYLSRYANKAFRMVVYKQVEAEEILFKARCVCTALNVREGPSIAYKKIDLLKNGEVVNVYEEGNNWFRIGEKKWCSGYPQYMEKIEIEPPVPPPLTLEERIINLENEVVKLWKKLE